MTSEYCVNRCVVSKIVETFGLVQIYNLQAKRAAHEEVEFLSARRFQIDIKITSENNRWYFIVAMFFLTMLYFGLYLFYFYILLYEIQFKECCSLRTLVPGVM